MKTGDRVRYIGENKDAAAAGVGTIVRIIRDSSVEFAEVHFDKPLYTDSNSFCFGCLPAQLQLITVKAVNYYDGRY